jgi:hypothetical protein
MFTALHTGRSKVKADYYSYSVNRSHDHSRFIPIYFLLLNPFTYLSVSSFGFRIY